MPATARPSAAPTPWVGTGAGNYQLASGGATTLAFTGTATINKATLTIATAGTVGGKTYDGNTAATVLTNGALGGVVAGDDLSVTLGGTTFADKNAGDGKTVSGTYTVSGGDAGNYQFAGGSTTTAFTSNANIARASLTIVNAGTVQDKVYDGTTNATLTGSTFSGKVTGDDLSLGLSGAFADKNVGTSKAVNGSYTLSGADAGNYTVSGGGTFTGSASNHRQDADDCDRGIRQRQDL